MDLTENDHLHVKRTMISVFAPGIYVHSLPQVQPLVIIVAKKVLED
jgi:hypothetical protein